MDFEIEMAPIIFVIFLSLGLSHAEPKSKTTTSAVPSANGIKISGTYFADVVLRQLRKQSKRIKLNDITIPNQKFDTKSTKVNLSNGKIRNLGNIQRVGDVEGDIGIRDTTLRCAFSVNDVSADMDIFVSSKRYNASNGNVHLFSENITMLTVFNFHYSNQVLSLKEFQLTMGRLNASITGLSKKLTNGSDVATKITNFVKGPLLVVFSYTFKTAINAILLVVTDALKAAIG